MFRGKTILWLLICIFNSNENVSNQLVINIVWLHQCWNSIDKVGWQMNKRVSRTTTFAHVTLASFNALYISGSCYCRNTQHTYSYSGSSSSVAMLHRINLKTKAMTIGRQCIEGASKWGRLRCDAGVVSTPPYSFRCALPHRHPNIHTEKWIEHNGTVAQPIQPSLKWIIKFISNIVFDIL